MSIPVFARVYQPINPGSGHCLCADCIRQRPERAAEKAELEARIAAKFGTDGINGFFRD